MYIDPTSKMYSLRYFPVKLCIKLNYMPKTFTYFYFTHLYNRRGRLVVEGSAAEIHLYREHGRREVVQNLGVEGAQ